MGKLPEAWLEVETRDQRIRSIEEENDQLQVKIALLQNTVTEERGVQSETLEVVE